MSPAVKKIFIRLLIAAACLVLLTIVLFSVWRVRLANDVERRLAAIRAAGLPASGTELNSYYPAVPDSENAALVITQAFANMACYPDERSNAVAKFKVPAGSQPLTSEQKQLLAGHVELNRVAIQTAMQRLLRSKCRYPIDMSPGFATLVPHLPQIRDLAQTICFEGMLAAEDNKPQEAIQSIDAVLKLSKTLENEPMLISELIRFRMDNMAKLTIERCLNAQQLNQENLTSLNQALQGWERTNGLTRGMIGEQACSIPVFRMNFAQFDRFANSEDTYIRTIHDGPGAVPLTLLMRTSGFFDRDLQFYLTMMETNINLSQTLPPGNLIITNVWNDAISEMQRRYLIMSAMLLPALQRAYFKNAESIANIRLAKTAVTVEQFRLSQHRLPVTLDELPSSTSTETRTDPFDGQPLRYKRLEKGYVVYSVGDDGRDNGGRERPANAKSSDKTLYDITFTVER
jgi:hypothetical protein